MRLLIATTDCPPGWGGIQRVVHELASRLTHRWSVTVLAPGAKSAPDYDEAVNFRVVRTSADWQQSRLRCVAEMTLLARRSQPDLLFAAHVNALIPIVLAGTVKPKVLLLHGSELWAPTSRLITRTLASRADRVMAVSRFTAAEGMKLGISSQNLTVTPLAASLPVELPERLPTLRGLGLASDRGVRPFFVTVSRLTEPHKGHDVFLQALPRILRMFPEVCYVIVGGGHLAAKIDRLACDLGVRHAVRMTGPIDDGTKAVLLETCLAYVMISRESHKPALFEGFGIAYLEAALAGRPSIAGDSGGVRDAIVDGRTGVLVDPFSPESAARAALNLLIDRAHADRLGQAARERAENEYTWQQAVGRMEQVFMEVVR